MWQSIMRHTVIMDEISGQRGDVLIGIAMFQPNFVIPSRIVHKSVQPAELAESLLDGPRAAFRSCKVDGDESAGKTAASQFTLQFVASLRVTTHNDRNGTFACTGADDRGTDSLCPAGNNDYLFF